MISRLGALRGLRPSLLFRAVPEHREREQGRVREHSKSSTTRTEYIAVPKCRPLLRRRLVKATKGPQTAVDTRTKKRICADLHGLLASAQDEMEDLAKLGSQQGHPRRVRL
jgi:hypothetical protein